MGSIFGKSSNIITAVNTPIIDHLNRPKNCKITMASSLPSNTPVYTPMQFISSNETQGYIRDGLKEIHQIRRIENVFDSVPYDEETDCFISVVDNFFDSNECEHYLKKGRTVQLTDSNSLFKNGILIPDGISSKDMNLNEDTYLQAKLRPFLTNMVVLRLKEYDAKRNSKVGIMNHVDCWDYTAMICLNDDFIGGHTYFSVLNFNFIPKAGSLLFFRTKRLTANLQTMKSYYSLDHRMMHCGNPVTKGKKFILQCCSVPPWHDISIKTV